MKETLLVLVIAFLIIIIGFVVFTPECRTNEECVPAQCCHPISCVPVSLAPNCKDVFCTLECKPGTMDCGQGYCACIDGKCKAIIFTGVK